MEESEEGVEITGKGAKGNCIYLAECKTKKSILNLDRICNIKLRGNLSFSDFLDESLGQQSRTQF